MSFIRAFNHLLKHNLHTRIQDLSISSPSTTAIVEGLGCSVEELVQSIALMIGDIPTIIVMAGNKTISSNKYRNEFDADIKVINYNLVEKIIGHSYGSICPFGLNKNVEIYLDESLKQLREVYVQCGSHLAIIKLDIEELELCCDVIRWVNVCE